MVTYLWFIYCNTNNHSPVQNCVLYWLGCNIMAITLPQVPTCFVLGAGMESFMIVTGFYNIVGKKESERRFVRAVVLIDIGSYISIL